MCFMAKKSPKTSVLTCQLFGLAAVIMCTVWIGYYYGGFDWNNPALVFNYHPVFMVVGLMFCFGDGECLLQKVF